MKSIFSKFSVLLVVSLFLLSFSGLLRAASDTHIVKEFNVNPDGTLRIETDLGSIEVQTVSADRVTVEVFKEVKGWFRGKGALKNFEVSMDQSGDDVRVSGKWSGGKWRGANGLHVKFVIKVPKRYNVDLKTSGGSVSVDDLEGKVNARTSGGSLHFGSIRGPVVGYTSGGSISLESCVGDADIHTSGGSIRIGDVEGSVDARTSGGSVSIEKAEGNVIAKTSGGSIHVEEVMGAIEAITSGGSVSATISRQPKGRCMLKTSGGSVNVVLSDDIAVDLNASTSSGRVICDMDVTVQGKISKNKLVGKINGGGPELYLRTSGGKITIQKM